MKTSIIERTRTALKTSLFLAGVLVQPQILTAGTGPALAAPGDQAYPTRPVRVITGNPGATADILARHVGQRLAERWGQQVVVDNRGGGGGVIFAGLAAKAPPDGYTLVMGNLASHGTAVSLHWKLPYDPVNDFAPIARIALVPMVLIANRSIPAGNLREFISYAKQQPGVINYAAAGNGTGSHLTMELFKQLTGLDLVQIQYKGGSAQGAAIMTGEAKMGFMALTTAWPILNSGKVKTLAVASRQRIESVPNVPTLDESGLSGFESTTWFGMFAPARTAKALVARLNRDIVEILRTPAIQQELLKQGAQVASGTPEEFAAFVKSEIMKWRDVMKAAGITPQ